MKSGATTTARRLLHSLHPNSFTPPAGYFRMTRVWKVQETGTVGAVKVSIPSSLADHLLVSNNAASPVPHRNCDDADGNGNMVATVDFSNGQFFTLLRQRRPWRCDGGLATLGARRQDVFSDAGST